MALLKRSQIAAPGRTQLEVDVPALGGSVLVSSLATIGEQLTLLDAARSNRGEGLPRLFAACVLDADGEPLMGEAHWAMWVAANMGAAFEIEAGVLRAWGLGRDAVKDAEKN
jgi:hypothetical protein